MKKGQTGIEFIVSSVMFLITVAYASFTIINNMPIYHDYAETENLIAKSYHVSEYLLTDYLSAGTRYVLDQTKINNLELLCANPDNYASMRDEFNIDQKDVIIVITKVDDSTKLLDCRTTISQIGKKIIVRRYAVLDNTNNDLLSMMVAVI